MKNNEIRFVCNKCGVEVPKKHNTSKDGRILCDKCAIGVKLLTDFDKKKLGLES